MQQSRGDSPKESPRSAGARDASDVAERVKKIVVEHLGVAADKVVDSANFVEDLGADAVHTVELQMALEQEFGVEISEDQANAIVTVGDAIKFLEKATASSPDGADGSLPPKRRIINTRSAPLFHPGEEQAGYGLYTYVLSRGRTDRDSHFLRDIVATAPSAASVPPPLRAHIDLILIPANPCPTKGADCSDLHVETIADDLKANFNIEESTTILEELCANPPEQIVKFCREPFGEGPFLFTYARPVSKMNSIPPPFLFFDFTGQDEAAFPDYINAYEAVLKSDDFTDDSKLKTLRLRILDVYNRARGAARPTAEGAVKLIHLFYPGR